MKNLKYNFVKRDMNLEVIKKVDNSRAYQMHMNGEDALYWYYVTHNNLIQNAIDAMSAKNLKKRLERGTHTKYLEGMCHFLDNNPEITKEIFAKITNTSIVFSTAIETGVPEIVSFISSYVPSQQLIDHKKLILKLMKGREANKLILMYKNINERHVFNYDFLRMLIQNQIIDYNEIKKCIVDDRINVNLSNVGTIDKNIFSSRKYYYNNFVGGSISISQEFFVHPNREMFENFIIDFKNEINWDKKYYVHGDKITYSYNMIDLLHLNLTNRGFLDRIEFILNNVEINEKIIGYIFNKVLTTSIVFEHYTHPVINQLLDHKLLKSEMFDISKLIQKLLLIKEGAENNYVNHPILILMKKIYEQEVFYNVLKPYKFFSYWAAEQSKHFSRDICDFLISYHKDEITNLTEKDWSNINIEIYNYVKSRGINLSKRYTLWEKLLSYFIKHKKIFTETKKVDNKETIVKTNHDSIGFDQVLFSQIKDGDVKRLVSMIGINKQQYDLITDKEKYSENHQYMTNTLPLILNKIIENYLFLNIVNEEDSKEQICIQLKLLNKKTLEVLNQVLKIEEEKMIKANKVMNKFIESNMKEKEYNN